MRSVNQIRMAKAEGIGVTASVAFYHLVLTDESMSDFDQNKLVNPPLRTEEDRLALLDGIKDGTIDAVVSDHTPVADYEKEMEMQFAEPGMLGLELVFPFLMEKVFQKELSLTDLLRVMITGPSKIMGIEHSGLIRLNLKVEKKISTSFFHSKSINSPFIGRKIYGEVEWAVEA